MSDTCSIPIETASLDQLPVDKPLKYDEICRIIGGLYLSTNHRIIVMEEQFKVYVESLQNKVKQLSGEILSLRKELENERQRTGNIIK